MNLHYVNGRDHTTVPPPDTVEETTISDRIRKAAEGIHALEITNAIDLLKRATPRREWLIVGWMPHREVTLISGDGGIGKSTIALQLCASTAASMLWFGLSVRPGAALYVSCEDDEPEIHWR